MNEQEEECLYYDISDDQYGFVRSVDDDEKNSLTESDIYSIFDI